MQRHHLARHKKMRSAQNTVHRAKLLGRGCGHTAATHTQPTVRLCVCVRPPGKHGGKRGALFELLLLLLARLAQLRALPLAV